MLFFEFQLPVDLFVLMCKQKNLMGSACFFEALANQSSLLPDWSYRQSTLYSKIELSCAQLYGSQNTSLHNYY